MSFEAPPNGNQPGTSMTVAPEESNAAFAGPAVYVNRCFAAMGPSGVRIAFSEQGLQNSIPVFRSAVLLSYEDATNLHSLLGQLLKR
jgi:hypothetical protein